MNGDAPAAPGPTPAHAVADAGVGEVAAAHAASEGVAGVETSEGGAGVASKGPRRFVGRRRAMQQREAAGEGAGDEQVREAGFRASKPWRIYHEPGS